MHNVRKSPGMRRFCTENDMRLQAMGAVHDRFISLEVEDPQNPRVRVPTERLRNGRHEEYSPLRYRCSVDHGLRDLDT